MNAAIPVVNLQLDIPALEYNSNMTKAHIFQFWEQEIWQRDKFYPG